MPSTLTVRPRESREGTESSELQQHRAWGRAAWRGHGPSPGHRHSREGAGAHPQAGASPCPAARCPPQVPAAASPAPSAWWPRCDKGTEARGALPSPAGSRDEPLPRRSRPGTATKAGTGMGVLWGAGMDQGAAASGRGGCSPRAGGTAVPGWGAWGARAAPTAPAHVLSGVPRKQGGSSGSSVAVGGGEAQPSPFCSAFEALRRRMEPPCPFPVTAEPPPVAAGGRAAPPQCWGQLRSTAPPPLGARTPTLPLSLSSLLQHGAGS